MADAVYGYFSLSPHYSSKRFVYLGSFREPKVIFLIDAALWSGTKKFLFCQSNITSLLSLKLFLFCGLTLCCFMDNKSYLCFINIWHLINKSSLNQDLDSYHRL